MPLPLPDVASAPEKSSPARVTQARLRDIEANLEQMTPQLVQSEDGRLYLAWASLRTEQVDIEPFQHRPSLPRLSPVEEDDEAMVELWNSAALRRVEESLSDYGLQTPVDSQGNQLLAPANPVAVSPVDPWQVVWMGSRRQWKLTPGGVYRLGSVLLDYSGGDWDGRAGWFYVPVRGGESLGSPVFQAGQPQFSAGRPPDAQALRTITWEVFTTEVAWSAGTYAVPIAYVEPPSEQHKAPLILPWARGRIDLDQTSWAGFLNPRVH